jgi:hypothetical protein
MTVTPTHLSRAAGLSAVASGLLFALVQFIHPQETVANVDTAMWAITHYISFTMCVLGLVGVTGVYLRQVREAGVLGLVGYLMFSAFFVLTAGFQFVEAFALPEMTDDAPTLVTYFLGIGTGKDTGDLGAVTVIWPLTGALYVLGGLTFAAALYRARILARWPSVVLAAGTLVTLTIPAVPHSVARMFALPVAVAMIGLGASLWRSHRSSTAIVAAPALAVG